MSNTSRRKFLKNLLGLTLASAGTTTLSGLSTSAFAASLSDSAIEGGKENTKPNIINMAKRKYHTRYGLRLKLQRKRRLRDIRKRLRDEKEKEKEKK